MGEVEHDSFRHKRPKTFQVFPFYLTEFIRG